MIAGDEKLVTFADLINDSQMFHRRDASRFVPYRPRGIRKSTTGQPELGRRAWRALPHLP